MLNSLVVSELFVFYLLIMGHFFADFVLQRELAVKKKLINYEMLLHAAIAAFLFIVPLALLFYPADKVAVAACALFLVHAGIDSAKVEFNKKMSIKDGSYAYWAAIGFDQMLHVTTIYLLFTQVVIS